MARERQIKSQKKEQLYKRRFDLAVDMDGQRRNSINNKLEMKMHRADSIKAEHEQSLKQA